MSSFDAHTDPELPPIDQHLVISETRFEIIDGELVYVAPADEPHGTRHSKVVALVELHAAPDFNVACDMLTRTSKIDDIAPDVSVFPRARDPETGRRLLEQVAFEIVSTESLGRAATKAAKLVGRGVRRVFAIDIEHGRALEWSAALGSWSILDPAGQITDAVFAAALPIHALVHAAATDDVVAEALIAKRNPVIEAARAHDRAAGRSEGVAEGYAQGVIRGHAAGLLDGRAEGLLRGRAEAVIALLGARGIPVGAADRERIFAEHDVDTLARWIERAATCRSLEQLFDPPGDPPP